MCVAGEWTYWWTNGVRYRERNLRNVKMAKEIIAFCRWLKAIFTTNYLFWWPIHEKLANTGINRPCLRGQFGINHGQFVYNWVADMWYTPLFSVLYLLILSYKHITYSTNLHRRIYLLLNKRQIGPIRLAPIITLLWMKLTKFITTIFTCAMAIVKISIYNYTAIVEINETHNHNFHSCYRTIRKMVNCEKLFVNFIHSGVIRDTNESLNSSTVLKKCIVRKLNSPMAHFSYYTTAAYEGRFILELITICM